MEDLLVKELRQKIAEQQVDTRGEVRKVSRDEALSEAEYLFKRTLLENRPRTLEEAQTIFTNLFRMIYAYFRSLDYDIPPNELVRYLLREI